MVRLKTNTTSHSRGRGSAGKNGEVFYGTEDVFTNAFTTERVNFPCGGWYLALSRNDRILMDVPWSRIHSVRLIGYGLMLILMGAYFAIYAPFIMCLIAVQCMMN
ncbi:hypothetical protein OH492_15880 [Vibrio chagasii]|nr:hypothetical protein [Vibrio chagasii]